MEIFGMNGEERYLKMKIKTTIRMSEKK
jgi:hypothetical protein